MNFYPTDFYQETDHQPLKVSLFASIQEMRGLFAQLDHVNQMAKTEKRAWLKENEGYLRQLLEKFVHHLPVELDDDIDQETVNLMIEYTTCLQSVATLIQNILGAQKKLKG